MSNYDTTKNNFDDSFKNKFGDFEAAPSAGNWNQISNQLKGEEIDAIAKNKLHQLEVTPEPHIWENVKKKLPLSLYVRNQLNWLSGVAAALIIFMMVMIALDKNNTPTENIAVTQESSSTAIEEVASEQPEQDFVYAIDEPNKKSKKNSSKSKMSEEDEETIANFWDDFLEEDEDLVSSVDNELVEESLKPIHQLPIENLEAALPITTKVPQQIIVGKSNQNVLETILKDKTFSKK